MGWNKDHGTAAKVNADYAKAQGDVAKQEATNLAQLKTDVEVATQNASTAADNANVAKADADNAASEAITQANHAKNEGDRAKAEADRLAGTDVSVLDNKIGSLSSLNTTNKTSVVESVNEVTTQLAETATKSEVQSLVTNKAEKFYVDQQIANIGNASPKGTYVTLSALQTTFPTGTTGIYVVTDDGKWYYWNGTKWTAGGVYQSTGISPNAINPINVSFIEGFNLFNGIFGNIGAISSKISNDNLITAAIVEIKHNKRYDIKVSGSHNRFTVSLSNSLAIGASVNSVAVWGTGTYKDTEYVLENSGDYKYLIINLSYSTSIFNGMLSVTDSSQLKIGSTPIVKSSDLLLRSDIKGTTKKIEFTGNSINRIKHLGTSNAVLREDVFTFGDKQITEKRTLSTGESITFKHNLETLETEVI